MTRRGILHYLPIYTVCISTQVIKPRDIESRKVRKYYFQINSPRSSVYDSCLSDPNDVENRTCVTRPHVPKLTRDLGTRLPVEQRGSLRLVSRCSLQKGHRQAGPFWVTAVHNYAISVTSLASLIKHKICRARVILLQSLALLPSFILSAIY